MTSTEFKSDRWGLFDLVMDQNRCFPPSFGRNEHPQKFNLFVGLNQRGWQVAIPHNFQVSNFWGCYLYNINIYITWYIYIYILYYIYRYRYTVYIYIHIRSYQSQRTGTDEPLFLRPEKTSVLIRRGRSRGSMVDGPGVAEDVFLRCECWPTDPWNEWKFSKIFFGHLMRPKMVAFKKGKTWKNTKLKCLVVFPVRTNHLFEHVGCRVLVKNHGFRVVR